MILGELMATVLSLSLALIVFGLALTTSFKDATHLARHPELLVSAVLSINVIMPFVAAVAVAMFDLSPAVGMAIVALALSPVPPVLPARLFATSGREPYADGLLTATAAMAIVVMPFGIALIEWFAGTDMPVSASTVDTAVLASVLAPLIAGLVVRAIAPSFADRYAERISQIGSVLLIAAFIPAMFQIWPAVLYSVGNGTVVVLIVFALVGLAVGHYLGEQGTDDRTILALATSTRHPAIALAIVAATFPDAEGVLAAMLWHVVIGGLVTWPYRTWRKHARGESVQIDDIFAGPHNPYR